MRGWIRGDSRREWARRFHALGKLPFGAAFNERLRALTDAVVRRGANSGGPNGSALSQVRTVEATMGPAGGEALNGWEIREFHLVAGSDGKGYLQVVPLAITPARELVVTQDRRLTNWLARNQDAVLAGRTVPLPESMRAPFGHPKTGAYVQGPTNDISNAYNVTTCVGCHGQSGQQARDSDSNDGLTQASRIFSRTDNPQFPGFQVLSSFVRNVDLERRSLYMGDLLKSGSRAPLPPLLPAVAIASSTPALVVASDIPHKRVFAEFEIEGASRDFAVELVKPGGASLWVYPPAQHLGQVELDAAEASRGTWTAKAWGGATVRSWTLYFTR